MCVCVCACLCECTYVYMYMLAGIRLTIACLHRMEISWKSYHTPSNILIILHTFNFIVNFNINFNINFNNISMKVQATMKMKEVVDLCQGDIRFRALKTAGERKQAFAEFQVICYFIHCYDNCIVVERCIIYLFIHLFICLFI